ncbi:MAG: sugar phosphate isomerase/epimerase [Desulfobacterales bacterium]|nr:sugar phosphate isomerase/epimerase [Desulfobacterales bacterium]
MAYLELLDIQGVELEYRLTDRFFAGMRDPLMKSPLQVTSIHNYCPFPIRFEELKPGGDLFLLSSPDREESKQALDWTTRTIEMANDLEAGAVVLHCGKVEMDAEIQKLHGFFKENRIITPGAQTFIGQKLKELEAFKPAYLDSLLFSLDRLLPVAEKQGVTLGLENRVHYHELPGPDDFERLLAEFAGGPVGYWHDTGHAHLAEKLTIVPKDFLLEQYASDMVGVHIHDAAGLKDHLAPGTGEIDFDAIKPHIKPEIPIVIELKPGTSDEDIQKGLDFMRAFSMQA